MAPRIRKNVWQLSVGTDAKAASNPWHPILDGYARAVAALASRSAALVNSWLFLANTHRTLDAVPPNALWNACTHQEMYFLAWHRAYLGWFEKTIQAELRDPSWALPYWNYNDPAQPTWNQLPPEFRVPKRTVNGALVNNPLFASKRAPGFNSPNPATGSGVLSNSTVEVVRAMAHTQFVRAMPDFGFGGQIPPPRVNGAVESSPHNNVHGAVGGQTGLMGSTRTAGRDPIFWLHHANIDRLWVIWRTMPWAVPIETDPAVPAAQRNAYMATIYTFGYSTAPVKYKAADVVSTTSAALDYQYDVIALPPSVRASVVAMRAQATPGGPMGIDEEAPSAWFAHAEKAGVAIPTDGGAFAVGETNGPMSLDDETPAGLIVQFNGVRAEVPAPGYRVLIATSEGGAKHDAGQLTTFGLAEASSEGGLDYSVDATPLIPTLVAEGWSGGPLVVTIAPEVAEGWRTTAGLRIASVKLFLR